MIKLSEIPHYRDYGAAIAEGDYERAKRNLMKCIEIATKAEEPETVSMLLQFIGDTEYAAGDLTAALASYNEAELKTPDSPLARITFARFLALRCSDRAAALQKCDEAEEILKNKWRPDPDDLTEEQYNRRINEVREIAEQIA